MYKREPSFLLFGSRAVGIRVARHDSNSWNVQLHFPTQVDETVIERIDGAPMTALQSVKAVLREATGDLREQAQTLHQQIEQGLKSLSTPPTYH